MDWPMELAFKASQSTCRRRAGSAATSLALKGAAKTMGAPAKRPTALASMKRVCFISLNINLSNEDTPEARFWLQKEAPAGRCGDRDLSLVPRSTIPSTPYD